jgi:putative intracellular protease/amidase
MALHNFKQGAEEKKEENKPSNKVIIVVTNYTKIPDDKKKELKKEKTGWYLPEVAHPYYYLTKNGIEVTFASPKGGEAECDPDSIKSYEKDEDCIKFINEKLNDKNQLTTYAISALNHKEYAAIFFAGGHGTMFDFPKDHFLQSASQTIYENGGIVSAVCHGPAALINIKLNNNEYLIKNKNLCSFTNSEEKASKLDVIMPFMLEDELKKKGANFKGAKDWSENVIVDGRLITGQNPSSAIGVAKEIVKIMKKK